MIIYSKNLLISAYKRNEVVLDVTSGSGSLKLLENGIYKIEIVGGGGGGASALSYASSSSSDYRGNKAAASGGSGACFVGEVYCKRGTYAYTCGDGGTRSHKTVIDGSDCSAKGANGENSYIKSSNFKIIAGGGYGGSTSSGYKSNTNSATGGSGGTLNLSDNVIIANYTIKSNGFKGETATGRSTSASTNPSASTSTCLSPYTIDTTVGSGCGSSGGSGSSGKLKITFLRKR